MTLQSMYTLAGNQHRLLFRHVWFVFDADGRAQIATDLDNILDDKANTVYAPRWKYIEICTC